jgi:hypothetical protein
MWIESSGSIRTGTSYQKFHGANPFWLVVECDRGLSDFYSDQIKKSGERGNVNTPLAGAHISVVRNEKPKAKDAWRGSIRKRISYEYQPLLKTNGLHWWLPVRSEELVELRKEFGLFPHPSVPFHLTVSVVLPPDPIEYGKVNPTITARINILKAMKKAFHFDIWESLPECQELLTLTSKFL